MADLFGDLGGAVADIFGGIGDQKEASAYKTAATLAEQNAQIAQESTAIQEVQTSRNIYQTISSQKAEVGGAGFGAGGSAGDLLRSSAQQGELQKQLVKEQGLITEKGYLEQANAYQGMASAAEAASSGGFLGGILKGISAVAGVVGLI